MYTDKLRFNSDWPGYSPAFGGHPARDTWADPGGNSDGMPFRAEVGLDTQYPEDVTVWEIATISFRPKFELLLVDRRAYERGEWC